MNILFLLIRLWPFQVTALTSFSSISSSNANGSVTEACSVTMKTDAPIMNNSMCSAFSCTTGFI